MKSSNDQKEDKNTTTRIAQVSTRLSEGSEESRTEEGLRNAEDANDALISRTQEGRMHGSFSRSYTPPMAVECPLHVIDNPSAAPYFDPQLRSTEDGRTDNAFLFGFPQVATLDFSGGSIPAAASGALPPRRPGVTPNPENGSGSSLFFHPLALDNISSPSSNTPSSGSRPPPVTPNHMTSDPAMLNILLSRWGEGERGAEENFVLSPGEERDNWEDPIDASFGLLSRTTSRETTSSISSRENPLGFEAPPADGSVSSSMENVMQPLHGIQPRPEEARVAEPIAPRHLGGEAKEFSISEDF